MDIYKKHFKFLFICIMSVDVFGRSLKNQIKISKGPPGQGFSLTSSGDYDIRGKKLCNVGEAVETNDAINLNFLKIYIQNIKQEIINHNSGLLDVEIKKLEEQALQEKERVTSFHKDIIWSLIQEIIQLKKNRDEPLDKINKIASDFIGHLAD